MKKRSRSIINSILAVLVIASILFSLPGCFNERLDSSGNCVFTALDATEVQAAVDTIEAQAPIDDPWLSGWDNRKLKTLNGIGSIAGTVSVGDGETAVTGSGTAFTEWLPNEKIQIPVTTGDWYTISAITDDTHLTLSTGHSGGATDASYDCKHINYAVRLDLMYKKSIIPINYLMTKKSTNNGLVLEVGSAGQWDDYAVGIGNIKKKDSTFYMVHGGSGEAGVGGQYITPWRIGVATAPNLTDGGSWTKQGKQNISDGLDIAPGFWAVHPGDVYEEDGIFYVPVSMQRSGTDYGVDNDAFEIWLYSTTDFSTWTEIGWITDLPDLDLASLHHVTNPSIIKENSTYYMTISEDIIEGTREWKIRMLSAPSLYNSIAKHDSGSQEKIIYGNSWTSETFPGTSGDKMRSIRLKAQRVGDPAGNLVVGIRGVSSGKPIHVDKTYGAIDATYVPTAGACHISVRVTDYTLTDTDDYAVVARVPNGDAENYIKLIYDNSSGYADGKKFDSSDGGSTWGDPSDTDDLIFEVLGGCWADQGVVLNPSSYDIANYDCSHTTFDSKVFKYGDQFVIPTCADYENHIPRYIYLFHADSIGGPYTPVRRPMAYSDTGFRGRTSYYIDGNDIKFYVDHYNGSINSQVVHYSIDPNAVVSLESHSKTDFGDVRVTKSDGLTELDYWIEDKIDSECASIWIEFDEFPASGGTKDIYLYYGNAGASTTGNGANTFTFFDDFANLDNWDLSDPGSASVSGGVVTVGGETDEDYIATKATYGLGYAFRIRAKRVGTSDMLNFAMVWQDSNNFFDIYFNIGTSTYRLQTNYKIGGSPSAEIEITKAGNDDHYWIFEYARDMGANLRSYVANVLERSGSGGFTGAATYRLRTWSTNIADKVAADCVVVRKCLKEEPSWGTTGAEESLSIAKVDGVDSGNIAKLNGVDAISIAKLDGIRLG